MPERAACESGVAGRSPRPPGHTGAVLSRRAYWTVALVAAATNAVSYFDRSTFAALAPSVTHALHLSEAQYGWLTSAFSIAYLVAAPIAGRWLDDLGARRGLSRAVFAWSIVAALHALVPGFWTLFAMRIALGIAEGPTFPGAAQTVQRVVPEAESARAFGVLFMGSSLGGMAAPVVAGWLYGLTGDWRVGFVGTAVIGLAWIPLWLAVTRRPEVRAALDRPRAPAARGPAVRAVVRDPLVVRAMLGVLASAPAIGLVMYWGAKILARNYGVAQAHVGHFLWAPPLCMDAGMLAFGDLASRLPRRAGASPRGLFAAAAVVCASIALLPLAHTAGGATAIFGASLAGGGGMYTLLTADLLSRLPDDRVAFAGGVLAAAQSLALIIASPLIGASVAHSHGYGPVSIALGAWVVPGALGWIVWRPQR